MTAMVKERNQTLDILKAVAIVLVIVGHSSYPCAYNQQVTEAIYTFHMPLFFMVSGYCFKEMHLVRDIKRLLLPYAFMCAMYFLNHSLISPISLLWDNFKYDLPIYLWGLSGRNPRPINGDVLLLGPLWFLLAMFWCRQYFGILQKFIRNELLLLAVCFVMSCSAAYIVHEVIRLPLDVLEGMVALVFFAVGYLVKKIDLLHPNWVAILASAAIWGVDLMIEWPLDISTGCLRYIPLSIMGACAAVYLLYCACWLVARNVLHPLLQYIGSMTMPIFCVHAFLTYWGYFSFPDTYYGLLLNILLPMSITYVLSWLPLVRVVFGIKSSKVGG